MSAGATQDFPSRCQFRHDGGVSRGQALHPDGQGQGAGSFPCRVGWGAAVEGERNLGVAQMISWKIII